MSSACRHNVLETRVTVSVPESILIGSIVEHRPWKPTALKPILGFVTLSYGFETRSTPIVSRTTPSRRMNGQSSTLLLVRRRYD